MSREKDAEEGDRRSLVEEGTVCPEDINKTSKTNILTEAKWVVESVPEKAAVASVSKATTVVAAETSSEKVNVQVTKILIKN